MLVWQLFGREQVSLLRQLQLSISISLGLLFRTLTAVASFQLARLKSLCGLLWEGKCLSKRFNQ